MYAKIQINSLIRQLINYCIFSGLLLNTAGGALYSYVKYREGERKKKQHVDPENENESMASLIQVNGFRRHRDNRSKSLTTEEVSENGIWTHVKYENEAPSLS